MEADLTLSGLSIWIVRIGKSGLRFNLSFENLWASLNISPNSYINRKSLFIFYQELGILYQSLEGKAIFGSIFGDGGFNLELVGDGLSHIQVQLTVNSNGDCFSTQFETDQTQLLTMIKQSKALLDIHPYTVMGEIHHQQIFT